MHVGEGVAVNLEGFRVAAETYGTVHGLMSRKGTEFDINKAMRVFVRQIRRLIWPEKTYKTVNAGTRTKFRSPFHKERETLANSEFPSCF